MGSGFLPARGSPMLDTVVVAMFAVVVVLVFSVVAVRFGKKHRLHRFLQLSLAVALLLVVIAFELEVRFFTNWRELATPSPYYADGTADRLLGLHLAFAIPTPFVWGAVIWYALKHYKNGFADGRSRQIHRWGGRLGAALMILTAITGWIFYWAAFVA